MTRLTAVLIIASIIFLAGAVRVNAHEPHVCPPGISDEPALSGHIHQEDITSGTLSFREIFDAGLERFTAEFNICDGAGRPNATGAGIPTKRSPNQPAVIRTSGPDANSCAGCHNQPRTGGAGDFVANVFVMAQVLDPVTYSISADVSDERNTLGMMGAGPIEALAREMTADLWAIRDRAKSESNKSGMSVMKSLDTKGVNFGNITAYPNGTLDTGLVQGVDTDLIIKPFSQKGVVRSIREFTVNAFNQHSGMEAVERFGLARTGTSDFDGDGVPDELSIGDITVTTIFQAALGTPGRILPTDPARAEAVKRGEKLFNETGCTTCHKPFLILDNPVFCEPNPINPPGTFSDVKQSYCFDMTKTGEKPRLEKIKIKGGKDKDKDKDKGKAIVRAYTDLKRHRICDAAIPQFNNEKVVQQGVPNDQFITRKLWDVGNSAPYGHRGDLSTIYEAILAHGGEGRASRNNYINLSATERLDIVKFLKTLQVLPPSRPLT